MTTSPAKPWETAGISNTTSIDSSGINNSLTPITKHTNNPHINRSGSSSNPTAIQPSIATVTETSTNDATNTTIPQTTIPQQPMYNSLGMGGGMYGNSMYGGYGNSMYGGIGGMYGNGMYGGMGMNGMYNQPMGPMGFMHNMQMSVNTVGRFSQLLQMGAQALHMTFSSLVQFAGNIGMMMREFGGFLSGVYIFRFIKWLYQKMKKFIFWLIGKKPSTKEQFEEMFQSAVDATSEAKNGQNSGNKGASSTHYSWLSIGFYCFGIMYVIQWIYKSISNELNQQKKIEQQQQQANMQQQQQGMMNPMNGMYGYGQPMMNGYGVQPGYGGMYGQYGMNPMIGQPQPQQIQTQNNNNNSQKKEDKDKDKASSDDDKNKSESLLAKPKDGPVTLSG